VVGDDGAVAPPEVGIEVVSLGAEDVVGAELGSEDPEHPATESAAAQEAKRTSFIARRG
jgi:hypothetical protein